MKKRSKKAIMNRVRYYNRQLPKEKRQRLSKKLSVKELNQIERDTKTNVYAERMGFDIKTKNVESKNVKLYEQLSKAYKKNDIEEISKTAKRIKEVNQNKIESISENLQVLKDVGNIEFIAESLKDDSIESEDIKILMQSTTNEDYVAETLNENINNINSLDAVKDIGKFDMSNIDTLSKKAKQYLKNVLQSPKIALTVSKDDFDLVE